MKSFSGCIALSIVLFSCSQPETQKPVASIEKDKPEARIKRGDVDCDKIKRRAYRMDSVLMTETEVNNVSATQAIEAFTDFVWYCANDSLSPVFLVKTAQVARAINNIPQAQKALETCINDYRRFTNRPAALFMLGQLYDDEHYLNDEHEAKKYYQMIIDEYPQSDWTPSARAAISFLGKTDEQIMKEFRQKEKKQKNS
jgi:hypothetical protein